MSTKEFVVLRESFLDELNYLFKSSPWLRFEPCFASDSTFAIPVEVNVFSPYPLCSSEISKIKRCAVSMHLSCFFDIDYDVVKRCFVLTFYA